jgi:transcription elongation factor GreA
MDKGGRAQYNTPPWLSNEQNRKASMTDPNQVVQMTQQGYDELIAEVQELKDVKIPAAIERVAQARSYGDLSENSEYHAAREDLAVLNGRLEEIEFLIRRAQVVTANGSRTVGVGSKVVVKIAGKNPEHVFHVVGEWEADPAEKKISEKSPLGQALSGKKKGDQVEFEAPAGKVVYHIQDVK